MSKITHKALTLALALVTGFSPLAMAAPSGMTPVVGTVATDAASTTSKLILNIAGKGAIINWTDFSLSTGESATFNMASNAAVLNRVTGGSLSTIAGQINSPGKVFLVNPSGIVFANGATINTGLFFATTHSITDANFTDYMNGTNTKLLFSADPGAGGISFTGTTQILGAGNVTFLGTTVSLAPGVTLTTPTVTNQGNTVVQSPSSGAISIVAAQGATFNDSANGINPVVQFQGTSSNTVSVGTPSGAAKVQAQNIFIGAGGIDIEGVAGNGNGSFIHNNSGTALLLAANVYGDTDSHASATPDNVIKISNSRIGFKSGETALIPNSGSGVIMSAGQIQISNATINTPSNVILAAANDTYMKNNPATQQMDVNFNTVTGNSVITNDPDGNGTINANNITGSGVGMYGSDINLKNANVNSTNNSIELFTGSNFAGIFKSGYNPDYQEQVTSTATAVNTINLNQANLNATTGPNMLVKVDAIGGQINITNGSQIIAGNSTNTGNVELIAHSSDVYKRVDTGSQFLGTIATASGASVNVTNSQITAGYIQLQGNSVTNAGSLHAQGNGSIQMEAVTKEITNSDSQQVSIFAPGNTVTNAATGQIKADLGDITMVGNAVTNSGSITAPQGTVILGALDRARDNGTITAISPQSVIKLSGSDITTKTVVDINNQSTDYYGNPVPHVTELTIDPTNAPLTTVTKLSQTQNKTSLVVTGTQTLQASIADAVNQNSSAVEVNAAIDAATQSGDRNVQQQTINQVFTNIRDQSRDAIKNAAQYVMQTVPDDSKRDVSQAIVDGALGTGTFNQSVNQTNSAVVRSISPVAQPPAPPAPPAQSSQAPVVTVSSQGPANTSQMTAAPQAQPAPVSQPSAVSQQTVTTSPAITPASSASQTQTQPEASDQPQ